MQQDPLRRITASDPSLLPLQAVNLMAVNAFRETSRTSCAPQQGGGEGAPKWRPQPLQAAPRPPRAGAGKERQGRGEVLPRCPPRRLRAPSCGLAAPCERTER